MLVPSSENHQKRCLSLFLFLVQGVYEPNEDILGHFLQRFRIIEHKPRRFNRILDRILIQTCKNRHPCPFFSVQCFYRNGLETFPIQGFSDLPGKKVTFCIPHFLGRIHEGVHRIYVLEYRAYLFAIGQFFRRRG